MSSRSSTFSRLLADYGMVFVLALLCAFFSFATYTEQHPTSADAARQLANSIATQFGKSARVLIA
ncbi:MAG: ABC transporter permease, partial [Verrucomicrobia bacterium]|nr:ABC transporter permease [Verrucomicrobiota bacterium]